MTYEKMMEVLEELADEIPEELFEELNGGIILLPDAKKHPQSIDDDLYILGEYEVDPFLGCQIVLYHGSFELTCEDLTEEELISELRTTLRHELTHHIEMLAGERGLEKKDDEYMAKYLSGDYPDDFA